MLHVLSEGTSGQCLRMAGVGEKIQAALDSMLLPVVQQCCPCLVSPAGACCECTGTEAGQARAGRAVLHLLGPACYGWAAAWVQVRGWQAPSAHRMSCHAATDCSTGILHPSSSLSGARLVAAV